jgi:DDB1- and CUL4-associated factor 13
VLHHVPSDHVPARSGDPTPVARNLDPLMHPFAKARERVRALNAAKIERMFAKPFLASLEGHVDGVNVVVRKMHSLAVIASASADGGIFSSLGQIGVPTGINPSRLSYLPQR